MKRIDEEEKTFPSLYAEGGGTTGGNSSLTMSKRKGKKIPGWENSKKGDFKPS